MADLKKVLVKWVARAGAAGIIVAVGTQARCFSSIFEWTREAMFSWTIHAVFSRFLNL